MMRLDILNIDEPYNQLHLNNFKKCSSDWEKERYRKQLYNILSKKNAHIQSQMNSYEKAYEEYKMRKKRINRKRDNSENRRESKRNKKNGRTDGVLTQPSGEEYYAQVPSASQTASNRISQVISLLPADQPQQPVHLEPLKLPTANICIKYLEVKLRPDKPEAVTEAFTNRQMLAHINRKALMTTTRNQTLYEITNHNTGSQHCSLTMVGNKLMHYRGSMEFPMKISANYQYLLCSHEDKENGTTLPGIFKTKYALIKMNRNCMSLRPINKKETHRYRLMQGLLFLEKVHKRASQNSVLLGQKLPL